jgi:hypothetical protein
MPRCSHRRNRSGFASYRRPSQVLVLQRGDLLALRTHRGRPERLRSLIGLLSCCMTLGFMASATGARAQTVKTYLVGETINFSVPGQPAACMNTNLNVVTLSLTNELNATGWTGIRFVDGNSFPQDYREACSPTFGAGGQDSNWADARTLAVYAGHGNTGLLQWGTAIGGQCTSDFSTNMRLGSMAGAQAAYGVWMTSCTLRISSLVNEANWQWLRQNMGYNNSPRIADLSAGNFI